MNTKKYIYDIKMANYFMMNGAVCIGTGKHKATGNIYWCFMKDTCQHAYEKWNTLCDVKSVQD